MSHRFSVVFLLFVGTALGTALTLAQQPAADDPLQLMDKSWVHIPTKSMLITPEGWEVGRPAEKSLALGKPQDKTEVRIPLLFARRPTEGVDVLFTWSPVSTADAKDRPPWSSVVDEEQAGLETLYGKANVRKGTAIAGAKGEKSGVRFDIDSGPARDGREIGVVFLFELTAENRDRWKLKVRGTVLKARAKQGLPLVEGLLTQLRF